MSLITIALDVMSDSGVWHAHLMGENMTKVDETIEMR